MKNISIITHKLAEVIRDMITLEEINKDCRVTLRGTNLKDTQSFLCVSINQYPDFSEGNLILIKTVFEDAFKDTVYSVKVDKENPKTIKVAVVKKE